VSRCALWLLLLDDLTRFTEKIFDSDAMKLSNVGRPSRHSFTAANIYRFLCLVVLLLDHPAKEGLSRSRGAYHGNESMLIVRLSLTICARSIVVSGPDLKPTLHCWVGS